ncbi:hypothetical protein GGQ91_000689 [Methylobacterium fujisawaense]|uniref:Uncharacterized protein n=1 Tax=Methylobacterium fujisawaense TaxID=107400 RepID=A0ABR6D5S0_9HYPH|nr:hypothetical protein [Methylobacterium fujisawaense]
MISVQENDLPRGAGREALRPLGHVSAVPYAELPTPLDPRGLACR